MSELDPHQKPLRALSGLKKASVLLVALGAEISSSVMQQLSPDEIERLTSEIVQLNHIEPDVRREVLDESRKRLKESGAVGGTDYARALLEQVVGEAKAKEMLGKLNSTSGFDAFRWLRQVPPRHLALCVSGEKPQVGALVLGHLPAEHAAQVLACLPEHIQGEVALRLTTMQPPDPEVVRNVADILFHRVSAAENAASAEVGGSKSVAQILNNIDRTAEKNILDYLTRADEKVATEIKEGMFVFDNIPSLDDRAIQAILRDVPQEDLRLALKGTTDELKDVFYRNMSQRAVETLRDDLESSGPVKLREVEAAQSRIAGMARQLADAGEITLRDSGDEVLV